MSQTKPHIIILGGGYAGLMAALRLAGKARGSTQPSITLVNDTPDFTERIRLHQQAAGQILPRHPIDAILKGTGVNFRLGRVTSIDPDMHTIVLSTKIGQETLHYDRMVYALGSAIDQDSVPGIREYAYTLSPGSAPALHRHLASLMAGAQVAICGGGLTGIEAATELAEAYPALRFTLITREAFGKALSAQGQSHIRRVFGRLGIGIRDHKPILRIDDGAVITQNDAIPASAVLWAGAFTVPQLAAQAGFRVNGVGQMLVDARLRSISHTDVYAAGDAAQIVGHPIHIRMACATAMPMATHAADNLVAEVKGTPQRPFRFGYIMRCISLGRHDGLIQMVNADDTPREQVFTGRTAALIKEFICRFTVWSLWMERRYPGAYRWPQPDFPPASQPTPRDAVANS